MVQVLFLAAWALAASGQQGEVRFGGLPVPGATVLAIRGDEKHIAITDERGAYSFPDLADGAWTIQIEMLCFATIRQEITVGGSAPGTTVWELKLLPLDEMKAAASPPPAPLPAPSSPESEPKRKSASERGTDVAAPEAVPAESDDVSDGFLINGSVNNGAASPFGQSAAFGNNRKAARGLYTGGIGMILDDSALDARAFSLTGQDTPKPAYYHLQGVATLGGPLKIPHLLPNGPNFFIGYQWTRNRNATTQSGLMPTTAERNGELPGGLTIPTSLISPQARALLNLFPLPNFDGGTRYNYQIPMVGVTHQDSLQARLNKSLNLKNQLDGRFAFQSTRTDSPNLFGFLDTTDLTGFNASANWRHSLGPRVYMSLGFQFSRLAVRVTPYFDNRINVSGQAGITGNNQEPQNWGPPALVFSGGTTALSDAQASYDRNQTVGVSYNLLWNRSGHNLSFGTDVRRQQFNYLSQQDARGTFTFTGAATGSDLADFLLGIPDTSSIAFGNADKYFRESVWDAYANDDWRISPELTLNAGVRWEYGAPITELYGRLVNLDIAPGFTAVAPVVATDPLGTLTGQRYPSSLIRPDKHGIEPRVGIAWRPVSGSSMVVRAGYGVYYNTSVYQNIALQMAQQSPLSKSLSVQNSPADPLTLANGFNVSPSITPNTFAIDPNFRVGYAQNWNLSVQRDLPGSLVMTATYLGVKGTRGMEEFLPNTFPAGAPNPCPACPAGFAYLTSNGNSTRETGQIQLRRRLHNGFAAMVQYAFSKAIDDSALGGRGQATSVIAQNWLDLSAERALSIFDQRHLLSVQAQYSTGLGLGGGTLLEGWRGSLFKEWTFATQITAGSGLPLTPTYLAAVSGTGVTGSIRPDYTGASVYAAPPGLFLNPAAYAAPPLGQWGNAGRDSITGPAQFALNASLGRTFRWGDRMNIDLRIDSTNALNHVTFTSWNTTVTSTQFGLPVAANAMRSVQTTLRLRF